MRMALAAIGALSVLVVVGAAHADVRDLEWGMCVDAGVTHSPQDSAAACTEIIQDGAESTATIAIAYVYRGQSLLRGGRVQLALNDFDQAIRLDIHSAPAYRGRAKAYEGMANYARAIRDFDQAGTLDQRNEATFAGRCRARAEANRDLSGARAACNAGLALTPADPELLAARGLLDLRQGRLQEAQRDFSAAIEANDTMAAAYYGRGLAATRAGHDGAADLARATQLDSGLAQRYAALDLASATTAAQSDQIVVIGRTDSAVRNFVTQMAVAPRDSQLARWDTGFCPSLAGLQQPYAQRVIDRIAQRADALGLDMGQPGCHTNVLILISQHADATALDLFHHNRRVMGYFKERGQRTLGRDALTEFLYSNAPVRWWHVSHVVTRDGEVVGDPVSGHREADASIALAGGPDEGNASLNPSVPGAPIAMLSGGNSRVRSITHDDFGVVYIIVDAEQLGDIGFDALSDYLAMVTLAQLDPDADTSSFPTILNLFNGEANRPQAMTDWDVSYLQGLYAATRDARNLNQQRSEIAQHMDHTLQAPPSPQ